jgi:hypothetical protein
VTVTCLLPSLWWFFVGILTNLYPEQLFTLLDSVI